MWVQVIVLCYLVISSGVAVGAVDSAYLEPGFEVNEAADTSGSSVAQQVGPTNDTADNVLRLHINPDGSATGTVIYRTRLDDANETAAFEELHANIRTNPASYTASFAERMTAAAAAAEVATGREMSIGNVSVRAVQRSAAGTFGLVIYTFEWQRFAASDGKRLQVGDALSGFFLDTETRLVIAWPGQYRAESVRPPPDERRADAAVWAAPTAFEGNEPTLILVPTNAAGDDTNNTSAAGGLDGVESEGSPIDLSWWNGLLILVILVSVVALGWTVRRRAIHQSLNNILETTIGRIRPTRNSNERPTNGRPLTSGEVSTAEIPADDDSEERLRGDAVSEGTASVPSIDLKDDPSWALLSNEERVLRVFEQHDSRIKQWQVAEELGWSAAKTSQVIRTLRQDGRIEGFRLGRENVLWLAEDGRTDNDDRTDGTEGT